MIYILLLTVKTKPWDDLSNSQQTDIMHIHTSSSTPFLYDISNTNDGFNHGLNMFLDHRLPLELAHKIFHHLDLYSLGKLLLVGSKSKYQVESLLDYSLLRYHAYNTYTWCTICMSLPTNRLSSRLTCVLNKQRSHPPPCHRIFTNIQHRMRV